MMNPRELYDFIIDTIKQFIQKESIPKMMGATVVSYSAPNAVIRIGASTTNIPNVPNRTGQVLNANDYVIVTMLYGSASNMFISHK